MKKMRLFLFLLAAPLMLSMPINGLAECEGNLIVNGGFESGNDGSFSTSFSYCASLDTVANPFPDPCLNTGTSGYYSIGQNPGFHTSSWFAGQNYPGNMLIVNGGLTCKGGVCYYPDIIWSQDVPVEDIQPNTTYAFSFSYASIVQSSYSPEFEIIIDNEVNSLEYQILSRGAWHTLEFFWTSGPSVTAPVEIVIKDISESLSGDDFAIDDICFYTPEQPDLDGDGVPNNLDNCPESFNTAQSNSDGDSQGDACDPCPLDANNDSDQDGFCGDVDNCPDVANDQADTENDGIGNICDDDDDNDGIDDLSDNCHFDYNPNQADLDGDGFGDVCDSDDDNDGIIDADDPCAGTPPGEIVDSSGCSIDQLCICENEWKNHGAYVKCVALAAEDFLLNGLISEADKDAIVSEAGQSECGHKK